MKASTAYNKQREAIRMLKDAYRMAKTFNMSSDSLSDKVRKVYDTLDKCPRHVREYVRGYQECLWESIWQHVEFCYLIDGVWHSTWKESDKPKVPAGSMSGRMCAHLWIGTDKPYTEIELIG